LTQTSPLTPVAQEIADWPTRSERHHGQTIDQPDSAGNYLRGNRFLYLCPSSWSQDRADWLKRLDTLEGYR
jgi:hypothetical protein